MTYYKSVEVVIREMNQKKGKYQKQLDRVKENLSDLFKLLNTAQDNYDNALEETQTEQAILYQSEIDKLKAEIATHEYAKSVLEDKFDKVDTDYRQDYFDAADEDTKAVDRQFEAEKIR